MECKEGGETVIGEAASLGEAVQAFADLHIHVVILDERVEIVQGPDGGGIVLRWMRKYS
jgi:DNA-binding NarL/FixJ family response regulator